MREDYSELLDKMFPDGYIICYTNKNCDFNLDLYNPHKYKIIEKFHKIIKENKEYYNCLTCGVKLEFIPNPKDDGGFCSGECEDRWAER